ncbi:MAG: phospholipase D-like domain-containing protein [Thermofilaceae archaeon]
MPAKAKRQRPEISFLLGVFLGAILMYFIFTELYVQRPLSGFTLVLLPNEEYFYHVYELMNRANSSIHIIMYVARYDPEETVAEDPANALITALKTARDKGLDVKVIVDDVTKIDYPETIAYLKAQGIPVKLDPKPGITTHAKLVIIDGRIVIIGSHNWTESALSRNNEYSVLIHSNDIALEVERYFQNLWENGRPL